MSHAVTVRLGLSHLKALDVLDGTSAGSVGTAQPGLAGHPSLSM